LSDSSLALLPVLPRWLGQKPAKLAAASSSYSNPKMLGREQRKIVTPSSMPKIAQMID